MGLETSILLVQIAGVAVAAAQEAGDFFRAKLDSQKIVKTKSSASDLVTEVDPECERMIRERILHAFPTHEILGEESTPPGSEASATATAAVVGAPHLWVVDPLDGTTNFVYEVPLSVVSIAYAENGVIQVGVIYDPYRSEFFLGIRNLGAWRFTADDATDWLKAPSSVVPGRKLSVSISEELEDSVVASGFPTRARSRDLTTEAGFRLSARVKSLRSFGSAAMHLAYVAAGRLDAFWEYDLNAWDLAAGVLLVELAGGHCMDLNGAPYTLSVRDIVVSGQQRLGDTIRTMVYFEAP
ncbi:MAG: hypothetical protein A2201_13140 [Alicyclobacillus sp. RIFOXYA1_FULL_53_8]|nr:MAG: hypothetical protein A2201_13140 [Alicyclobacillus sp. RIFOXYA1_FULL_53_8]